MGAEPAIEGREFEFSESDFKFLSKLVKDRVGIVLADHKRHMVYSRLARRLRELKYHKFSDYCTFIQQPQGEAEMINLINAITTNLTSFFREPHHFDELKTLIQKPPENLFRNRKIRIWSSGCSTGMEVYSIAMTIMDALQDGYKSWDIKLLATDIDTNVLDHGSAGVYRYDHIKNMDERKIKKYFTQRGEDQFQINLPLREMVHFKKLNLMDATWPMKNMFDVIFCRNVMIYFDKATQKTVVQRYAKLMPMNGHLMIGHSENLFNMTDQLQLIGRTVYTRVK